MLKRLHPSEIRGDHKLVHWYLIFTEVHHTHWWDRWLKPGFRHCYAARMSQGAWLVVNPRTDYTEIAIEAGYIHNSVNVLKVSDESAVVLSVIAQLPKHRLRSRFFAGPITCVEVVKSLLGIRAFFIFTPWQLYNYARSRRGTVQKAQNARTYSPGTEHRTTPAPAVGRLNGRGKPSHKSSQERCGRQAGPAVW